MSVPGQLSMAQASMAQWKPAQSKESLPDQAQRPAVKMLLMGKA
jgi:hypothetical protein